MPNKGLSAPLIDGYGAARTDEMSKVYHVHPYFSRAKVENPENFTLIFHYVNQYRPCPPRLRKAVILPVGFE